MKPIFADSPVCGPVNCNWLAELGFSPPLTCCIVLTPCLSAFVRKTRRVDRTTEIRGEMVGNQNSFLFLLPCKNRYISDFIMERNMQKRRVSERGGNGSYYKSGDQYKYKEGASKQKIFGVPLSLTKLKTLGWA